MIRPLMLGCQGPVLTSEEASFFKECQPFGFILFRRNCETPDQIRSLTKALRDSVSRDAPIFIDQEGGRVARLVPPHWPKLPALRVIGALYEQNKEAGWEAMRLHSHITAMMLRAVGIDGNCAPVLDMMVDGASSAIGDRALSASTNVIAELGAIAVETYLACGVYPVIKHLPGHGRVRVDPHLDLPFVDADEATLAGSDFVPFRALRSAPMGMNCHVVFRALDADHPVSLSKTVHEHIIRGAIGFEGLLLTDDLAMGALKMPLKDRVLGALAAGADVALYCTGSLDAPRGFYADIPPMGQGAEARFARAKAMKDAGPKDPDVQNEITDPTALSQQLESLLR